MVVKEGLYDAKYSIRHLMGSGPPLGQNLAPAAICSAVYFVCAVSLLLQSTQYKFLLVKYLLASCLIRGIAFALRASTVDNGSTTGLASAYTILQGGGFGLAIIIQGIALCGWLKNTTETHKPTSAARHLVAIRTFILFLCLICGPVFAILISVLSYSNPTPDSLAKANEVKKASTTNLLFASAFLFLLASWCCVTAVRGVTLGVGSVSWHQHPHIMVLPFTFGGLMLVMSAAFRTAVAFTYPQAASNESLFYPLQVLPEMIQAILMALPLFLMQVHLSSNFTSWWHDTHPDKDPSLTLGPLTLWSNSLPESEHDAGKGGKDGADADTQGLV